MISKAMARGDGIFHLNTAGLAGINYFAVSFACGLKSYNTAVKIVGFSNCELFYVATALSLTSELDNTVVIAICRLDGDTVRIVMSKTKESIFLLFSAACAFLNTNARFIAGGLGYSF